MAENASTVAAVGVSVDDDWRAIDLHMRGLAARRCALDAEEAKVLLAAWRAKVHRRLGLSSFDEYLARVLGYAPTTARERMRVASALASLPATAAALAVGLVSFSAVRALTRVVTPDTEQVWLDSVAGCTVREIEHRVRGRRRGDDPGDVPPPRPLPRLVRVGLTPELYSLFHQARRCLERRLGKPLTDADFIEAACRELLAAAAAPDARPSPGPVLGSREPGDGQGPARRGATSPPKPAARGDGTPPMRRGRDRVAADRRATQARSNPEAVAALAAIAPTSTRTRPRHASPEVGRQAVRAAAHAGATGPLAALVAAALAAHGAR